MQLEIKKVYLDMAYRKNKFQARNFIAVAVNVYNNLQFPVIVSLKLKRTPGTATNAFLPVQRRPLMRYNL